MQENYNYNNNYFDEISYKKTNYNINNNDNSGL